MPGGTDSNFRAWGEDTIYVDRGKGGRVWDMDQNEYVDLRLGYGPVMLGHADPRVDDYVNERMRRGVSFSLTSEDEVRACELICEITGWVDMARMTVSGTEATMHLMRIARAFTGREKIIKFEGQYHGVHDYALISVLPNDMGELGDRDNPVHLAWGRGIPEAVTQTVIPVPYNDLATLRRVFEAQGDEIAAVIIEPVLGNAQGILPKEGFHQGVRAITEEFGALLIFDEVKTGFRIARGGAAEFFGIKPDLASFAKAIGNGYPAAAFGGRREVMDMLPDKVSHGGTYAGNRVAAAAAVATLSILKDGSVVEGIKQRGLSIQAGLASILNAQGPALQLHRRAGDVRDHVHQRRRPRVPRLGQDGSRPVRRGRGRDAAPGGDARARLARAVVPVRGPRRRRRGPGPRGVRGLARCGPRRPRPGDRRAFARARLMDRLR